MRIFLTALVILFLTANGTTANIPPSPSKHLSTLQSHISHQKKIKTKKLKIRDIEKLIGRKLTVKEKIAIQLWQWENKNQLKWPQKAKSDDGKKAYIYGLIALIGFFIPFINLASLPLAILAIVKGNKARRENPDDRKARTGVTLGKITIALIILLALLVGLILIFGTIGPR